MQCLLRKIEGDSSPIGGLAKQPYTYHTTVTCFPPDAVLLQRDEVRPNSKKPRQQVFKSLDLIKYDLHLNSGSLSLTLGELDKKV